MQEQLLRCIEGIAAGSADNYISMLPGFVIEHSDIDLLELGKARSLLEIDERLTGTVYGRILRPLLIDAAETGRLNISECERRLYTSYYTKCIKKINSMYKGTEKTELKRAMLKSIDLVNVVTCCRMKAFAGSTPQMIHASLLPLHYRLNDQTIERLIQISDFSKLEAELAAIGYRTDSSAQTETVEQLTERISLSFFRRSLRLSQSSAVVYFSLQECLKIEQRNIKTAIEGIRYGLTSSEILEMLVI